MRTVWVVGAGQIGSRHLQALKAVTSPLDIAVVDPSEGSLGVVRERYEAVGAPGCPHRISFRTCMPEGRNEVDLAIVATNSDTRCAAIEQILRSAGIGSMILEKLLFDRREDYSRAESLLEAGGVKAWVNCSMRAMPFYRGLGIRMGPGPIRYHVSGCRYGLVTNAIHYIDHMMFLTGCEDFRVRTDLLDPMPVQSKRRGFLDLNGTLEVAFADGSLGILYCHAHGDAPQLVEIFSAGFRCISCESKGKAWVSHASSGWKWEEEEAVLPYHSQMTATLVEGILSAGDCPLVKYRESSRAHLALLEPLQHFLGKVTGQGGHRVLFT